MLGFDTAYHHTTAETSIKETALPGNRIILTRKTNFSSTDNKLTFMFIKDNAPEEQLRQVIAHYKIKKNS